MTILTDQQEWDELLAQIPPGTPSREAVNKLVDLLMDAVQAQRPWARQKLNEAIHAGLSKTWRTHVQRQRPKTRTKNGEVKGIGGVRRTIGAEVVYVQVPLDNMTADELNQYRTMYATSLSTLGENVRAVERLLKVLRECPAAKTPAEACESLGLDIENVMAGAA